MKSLIFLCIILFVYYQVYIRYPDYLSTKSHIYLGIFTVGYLVLYYILNYQTLFAYNLFKNIQTANDKPLYNIDSLNNYSVMNKTNNVALLKRYLSNRQGMRCSNCSNPILPNEIEEYSINYIKPINYGGSNDLNNVCLSCPTCNTFRPF